MSNLVHGTVTNTKSACIFDRDGKCLNTEHYREMTIAEQVRADIDNLRLGAKTSEVILMHPAAALRVAGSLEELLNDNITLESQHNNLTAAVTALRSAQREYMEAREARGGKNRVYDEKMNELGKVVGEAVAAVDAALQETKP